MFKLPEILKNLVITIVSLLFIYFVANYFMADSMKVKYVDHLTSQSYHVINTKGIVGKAEFVKAPDIKNQ